MKEFFNEVLQLLQQFAANKVLSAVITAVIGIIVVKIVLRILKSAFHALDPALSKLLLSFCMLAGRLEIFPMLILFSRSTWKHQ